jgi:hypothetical protein
MTRSAHASRRPHTLDLTKGCILPVADQRPRGDSHRNRAKPATSHRGDLQGAPPPHAIRGRRPAFHPAGVHRPDRECLLISAGLGSDGQNYLGELLAGGAWGRRVGSVSTYNTCVGILFRPSFSCAPAPPRTPLPAHLCLAPGPYDQAGGSAARSLCPPSLPPPQHYSTPALQPPPYLQVPPPSGDKAGGGKTPATGPCSGGFNRASGTVPSHVTSQGPGSRRKPVTAFTRRPASVNILGPALSAGVVDLDYTCPFCQASPATGGALQHHAFECLGIYARTLGEPCPGFDAAGFKDPAASPRVLETSRMEVNNNVSSFSFVAEQSPATRFPASRTTIIATGDDHHSDEIADDGQCDSDREPPQTNTVLPDPEATGLSLPGLHTTLRIRTKPPLHCPIVHTTSSLSTFTPFDSFSVHSSLQLLTATTRPSAPPPPTAPGRL